MVFALSLFHSFYESGFCFLAGGQPLPQGIESGANLIGFKLAVALPVGVL